MSNPDVTFVGVWFDLDEANRSGHLRRQGYLWRIWRRVVKATLDEHRKARMMTPPLPILAGISSQPWVQQRWPHRIDVEALFAAAATKDIAARILRRLRTPEMPWTFAAECLPPARQERLTGLVLDSWHWRGAILRSEEASGPDFHQVVDIPVVYWRLNEESLYMDCKTPEDAESAFLRLPVFGGELEPLPSPTAPRLPFGALASARVPATALAAALKRMSRLGRATPGVASWTFGPGTLRIGWMGMVEQVSCEVVGAGTLAVAGALVHNLTHSPDWPDEVDVVARKTELKVGSSVLDAEPRERPAPALLPINATPDDLLKLHVCEQPAIIAEAGLTEAVADVLARLERSVAAAAAHLEWLNVPAAELQAWLTGRLMQESAAPTAPAPMVVVVEANGQVRLFDE